MANIGDLVSKSGIYTEPGVVTKRNEDGTVVVNTEPMELNKYHRYANTTGLSEPEKITFNAVLDTIYQKESDVEKIDGIQNEIDKLKVDPKNKNVVQYLRNQQAHLVRTSAALPKSYSWDEVSLRF